MKMLTGYACAMLANDHDWSPEAEQHLAAGQMLVNYDGEAWVVNDNDSCNMADFTKVYRVL